MRSRRGSAIVGAVWILAVLSVLIATYAVDAQLQTRVNLYLQERVRVDHLTDAGIAIAEVILLDYQNVTVPDRSGNGSGGASQSQIDDFVDQDRWYWEKVDIKDNRECSTGAVPVDPLDPDGGTVTVRIKPAETKWNINQLYPQGDTPTAMDKIWYAFLFKCRIPTDYWDGIIYSWYDWRDSDDTDSNEHGAETGTFYKEAYEDYEDGRDEDKNGNYLPASRNGEISDLEDLMHLKGFNEYDDEPINGQALLDGGILNPFDKKEDQVEVEGLRKYFSVFGSGKININVADVDTISTIPGIWNPKSDFPDDFNEEDLSNAVARAEAIVQIRNSGNLRDVNDSGSYDDEVGTITSIADLKSRLENEVGGELKEIDWAMAEQYISFAPDKFFEISITGESLGITHTVKAVAIVQDGKVRYIRWQEDP